MQDDWGMDYGGAAEDAGGQWQQEGFPGMESRPRPPRRRFYLTLFVYALLGGGLGALIGQVIYRGMYDSSGSNVVMVGLILAVISGLVLLACAVCELHKPRITVNHELDLRRVLLGLLAAAAVFAIGCLCEFLYEWNSARTAIVFDDFVFAIDDSGSMGETDPENLRCSTLAELLDTMGEEERVGLVHFTEEIYTEPIEMAALDSRQRERLNESIASPRSDGNTDIYKALMAALEMHEDHKKAGRYPVVVLLSDGWSEFSPSEITKDYVDAGVAITTVSLGPKTDEQTLRELAESTGGSYFRVEQVEDLSQAFRQVSTTQTRRCLFSPRPAIQRGSILYMILRVVFLALPGALIGFFILWLLQSGSANRQLLVSGIGGLLAGLVMELGTYFLLPLGVVHVLSWLLYGVVLLHYNDVASNIQPSKFDLPDYITSGSSEWDAIPTGAPDTGKGTRGKGGNNNRIDRGDDWGGL